MAVEVPTSESFGRPLILVVEDRPQSRELRERLFKDAGCDPVGVGSVDDAVREIQASPGFDLCVTDIHLVPDREGDKSGIHFAKFLKERHPKLPVVGYSAYFEENQLGDDDRAAFDEIFDKAADSAVIEKSVEVGTSLARLYRRQRRDDSQNSLRETARGEGTSNRYTTLRDLMLSVTSGAEVEQALSDAGFRLKVVRPKIDAEAGIAEPFLVWLRSQANAVEVEVYGYPALYCQGIDDNDAISQLIELMNLYFEQLNTNVLDTGPLKILYEFLSYTLRH